MTAAAYTPKSVATAYVAMNGVFTLAASLIWAINTIFLIQLGGLTLFQVMLVNAIYTVGSMVFEVPTGVIADTIGRRASILLSVVTLMISTLLYVITPQMGWGFAGFAVASVLIGLGYTFQTGAMDAWLVDALDATGFDRPKDRIFAHGQTAINVGMLTGSLLGGLLGQFNLVLPYVVRAGLLAVCFVVVLIMVRDTGFEPRTLRMSNFSAETKHIFHGGVRYGWRSPVVRPMLWISAIGGVFFLYGFYAWQPYVLALLGQNDMVWVLGVTQAGFAAMGILGNQLVGPIMREGERRRDSAKVLEWSVWANAFIVIAIAAVGFLTREPGVVPAAIAIVLWLLFGLLYGVYGPVRMSFLNEHIPSTERATVLSLDAFFADAGGAVGQPTLGYVSQKASIQLAWLIGGSVMAASAPLYRRAGAAARRAVAARERVAE